MAKIVLVEGSKDDGSSEIAPAMRKDPASAHAPAAPTPLPRQEAPAKPADRPAEPAAAPSSMAPGSKAPQKPKGGRRRVVLAGVALIALAVGGYFGHEWWTVGRFMVSTDDAYVGADAAIIAPRIAGYVAKVVVDENKQVKAGDPLVYLDDSDQRVALAAAQDQIASQQAAIARIDKQIAAANTAVDQAKTAITSAAADKELALADLDRVQHLAANQFASQQALQQAKATADKTTAAVDAANAGLAAAKANVDVLTAQRVEAQRALDQAKTTLDQRQLDLDRTVIRAPFDGTVGNKAVEQGEFVAAGQRLFAVVPLDHLYVDANFKETQLARIRLGATAHVSVDAADGKTFVGTVESLAPGSGAVFSLLPADNATGNFTKITQRVPVRVRLPADAVGNGVLRPGLSVTVEVDSRTGEGATSE